MCLVSSCYTTNKIYFQLIQLRKGFLKNVFSSSSALGFNFYFPLERKSYSSYLTLISGPVFHCSFLLFSSSTCLINFVTSQLLLFYFKEQDNLCHNQLLQCLALHDPTPCFVIIKWQNALVLTQKKRKLMHEVTIRQQKASQGALLHHNIAS